MNKRISRSAFALVAAGLLVSPFVASQTANAQTLVNPGTITATAKFNPATPPAGVTGVTVSYNCRNYFTGGQVNLPFDDITRTGGSPGSEAKTFTLFGNATIAPTSGSFITNIGLQTVNLAAGTFGTSCTVTATMAGTANTASPKIEISVGGSDRTVTRSLIASGTNFLASAITAELPIQSSTDVVITVTFPSITVKKVIVGDEANPGFAYPMTIACSGLSTSPGGFVASLQGNPGASTYNINGPVYTDSAGTAVARGGLVLPGGAGFYVSLQDTSVTPTVTYNFYDYRSGTPASTTPPADTATVKNFTNIRKRSSASITKKLPTTASSPSKRWSAWEPAPGPRRVPAPGGPAPPGAPPGGRPGAPPGAQRVPAPRGQREPGMQQ